MSPVNKDVRVVIIYVLAYDRYIFSNRYDKTMTINKIENLNIASQEILITPAQLKQDVPVTETANLTIAQGRNAVCNILDRTDPRLIVVIGPCSIHDTKAAIDYAKRLKAISDEVQDTLLLVMRV